MKILNINKFFYLKGGSERYYFKMTQLLSDLDWEVVPFSMKDPRNYQTAYQDYFVTNIDYFNASISRKLINVGKILYSREAYHQIGALINYIHPDVAHVHLFQHQLSPSILFALKKHRIPIIYTVHDLKPLCANYLMTNKNGVCEECKGKRFYRCLLHRCVKNSLLGSMVSTLEMYIHDWLRVYKLVDAFIVPSLFLKNKMIEFGFPANKIHLVPHFIDTAKIVPQYSHLGYGLYCGRLSQEKGLFTLLEALESVPHFQMKIVGEGPLRSKLQTYVAAKAMQNVEFLGFQSGEELEATISNASCVICPSECYETFGFTILEGMAHGKPVIASDIGAFGELIENGKNGLLFKHGDSAHLTAKIQELMNNEDLIRTLGAEARKRSEQYNARNHLEKILHIYKQCLKGKGRVFQ